MINNKYIDPRFEESPLCDDEVIVLSTLGKGPKGDKGEKGDPITDEALYDTVAEYIEDHPGYVTTVMDGAITERKLDPTLSLELCRCFDTVEQMQNATDLKVGVTCHTNGFHSAGDGGAAFYVLTADGEPNGMDVLVMQNGLIANFVITESYVTLEQFGAWGDGTNDDAAAIKRALSVHDSVQLLDKAYFCTETITLTTDQKVYGNQNGYGNAALVFPFDTDALVISGRGVEMAGFNLTTTSGSTAKAITVVTGGEHWLNVHDVIISYFAYGIYTNSGMWCAVLQNIRINGAEVALRFNSGFDVVFTNVYTNACKTSLEPGSLSARFLCCNFGITTVDAFIEGTNVNLSFDTCNFECDAPITDSGILFRLGNGWYKFSGCRFSPNFPNNTTFFFSGLAVTYSAIFENCRCNPYDEAYGNTNFFAKSNPIGGQYGYGALKIIGCRNAFPRPDYYNTSLPNLIDYDRDGIAHFWSTTESDMIASGKVPIGAILMNDTTHTLCYYNGTSLIYLS